MASQRSQQRAPGRRVLVPLAVLAGIALLAWGIVWLSGDSEEASREPGVAGQGPSAGDGLSHSEPLDAHSSQADPGAVQSLLGVDAATDAEWDGANLRLRVVEAGSGRPLAGVRLSLYAAGVSHPTGSDLLGNPIGAPDAVSSPEGLAVVRVPPGLWLRLIAYGAAEHVGQCVLSIDALGAEERREVLVEVPVGSGSDYWGRLLDGASKRPIEGAAVLLFNGGPSRNAAPVTSARRPVGGTRSDARGLFVLHPAPWTDAFARIEAEGYGPVLVAVSAEHVDSASAEDLELTASAGLDVEVLDRNGGPLKGAIVTVSASSYDLTRPEGSVLFGEDVRWTGEIGWDGRFVFRGLAASTPLQVEVSLADQVLLREAGGVVLKPGETRKLSWRVGGRARLSGTLLDQAGAGVANQELWLASDALPARLAGEPCYFELGDTLHVIARCTTDAAGSFEFREVPAGTWLVGPAPRGEGSSIADEDAVSPWAEVVEILPDALDQQVTLRVARAVTIRGHVVGPDGDALASRTVQARPVDSAPGLSTHCDENGTFTLGPLIPGAWIVQAAGGDGLAPSDAVVVEAGSEGIELRLKAPSSLRGRLVGPPGEQLPSSQIVAWIAGATGDEAAGKTWSAPDESFQIDSLGAGRYDLTAHTGDGRVALLRGVEVEAGGVADGLELVLGPGARLRIHYDGTQRYGRFMILSSGSPVAVESVYAGTSKLVTVPAGPVEVQFSAAGHRESRALELSANAQAEISFTDGEAGGR